MKPLISVIVPVYNAGDAFKTCIESLLNQTLQEIQIILVLTYTDFCLKTKTPLQNSTTAFQNIPTKMF